MSQKPGRLAYLSKLEQMLVELWDNVEMRYSSKPQCSFKNGFVLGTPILHESFAMYFKLLKHKGWNCHKVFFSILLAE